MYLEYKKEQKLKGISLHRFSPPKDVFADYHQNPDNIGFCVPDESGCLGSGVLDVSGCKGALTFCITKVYWEVIYQPDMVRTTRLRKMSLRQGWVDLFVSRWSTDSSLSASLLPRCRGVHPVCHRNAPNRRMRDAHRHRAGMQSIHLSVRSDSSTVGFTARKREPRQQRVWREYVVWKQTSSKCCSSWKILSPSSFSSEHWNCNGFGEEASNQRLDYQVQDHRVSLHLSCRSFCLFHWCNGTNWMDSVKCSSQMKKHLDKYCSCDNPGEKFVRAINRNGKQEWGINHFEMVWMGACETRLKDCEKKLLRSQVDVKYFVCPLLVSSLQTPPPSQCLSIKKKKVITWRSRWRGFALNQRICFC